MATHEGSFGANSQELIRLAEITQKYPGEPRSWQNLAAALDLHGQKAEADFCRWRAVACTQNLETERNSRLEAAIQQLTRDALQQPQEPLDIFSKIQESITALLDRLLASSTEDDSVATTKLLVLFATVEPIRFDSLVTLAKQSWAMMVGRMLVAPEAQAMMSRMAALWADLFREHPYEMSHAYLSTAFTMRPTTDDAKTWRKFTTVVSDLLGRKLDTIVNEQIPDLP